MPRSILELGRASAEVAQAREAKLRERMDPRIVKVEDELKKCSRAYDLCVNTSPDVIKLLRPKTLSELLDKLLTLEPGYNSTVGDSGPQSGKARTPTGVGGDDGEERERAEDQDEGVDFAASAEFEQIVQERHVELVNAAATRLLSASSMPLQSAEKIRSLVRVAVSRKFLKPSFSLRAKQMLQRSKLEATRPKPLEPAQVRGAAGDAEHATRSAAEEQRDAEEVGPVVKVSKNKTMLIMKTPYLDRLFEGPPKSQLPAAQRGKSATGKTKRKRQDRDILHMKSAIEYLLEDTEEEMARMDLIQTAEKRSKQIVPGKMLEARRKARILQARSLLGVSRLPDYFESGDYFRDVDAARKARAEGVLYPVRPSIGEGPRDSDRTEGRDNGRRYQPSDNSENGKKDVASYASDFKSMSSDEEELCEHISPRHQPKPEVEIVGPVPVPSAGRMPMAELSNDRAGIEKCQSESSGSYAETCSEGDDDSEAESGLDEDVSLQTSGSFIQDALAEARERFG
mmetsp:Transcript_2328/g.5316  ORF Transcript_2328/g.5316 Transcript_2328/m.5316 type:complete len:513 (+) Transcript_2328:3-1541(+)